MIKNPKRQKAVILGGGLAGLTAGYTLAKAGWQVEVVEAEGQVGGLARTIEVNGFRFDTGPHRWFTKNESINKWMHKLLGKEIIQVPRLTRIYFDGKFFYYPIRLINALLGIGPVKAVRAVIDYFLARVRSRIFAQKLLTMEDGYISQFGKTLYETFFRRYSEKLWGIPCNKVSVDWVGQRTRGLNILTIIKDVFVKSKNVVSFVDEFSYPIKGIGRFPDKLAEEIKKAGGKIYTSAEALKINSLGNRIVSVEVKRGGKNEIIEGDHFISTIPISDLIIRLSPKAEKKILSLTEKLQYRDELQVALFVKKSHLTNDTWIYVHPKEIPFMRVMEMDNWSKNLSPNGTTAVVFEIACNYQDSWWRKSDQEALETVSKAYIREFGWLKKDEVVGGYVHRVKKEYPVYHLTYKEDLDQIKKYLKKFDNLQICGRNGTFRYNNMDHSVEMGLYAAWNLIEGQPKYDIESVNIEREYLEEKKIENIEDEKLDES